jgi:periplasmic protein TorT
VAFNAGFVEGIAGSSVKVVETKYGDVGKEIQSGLVEDILQTHKDLDYIVGTAVMAESAVPILKARGIAKKVKLVSVYMTPGAYQAVKAGEIEASGSAPVVLTARIMLDQAVRALEGKLEYSDVNTLGQVYTTETIQTLDPSTVLAPASFSPNFNVSK